MRNTLYVIEARTPEGKLDLTGRQPEQVFGLRAIHGITENDMAKTVFRFVPDVTLEGRDLLLWPAKIDPRWRARAKTW